MSKKYLTMKFPNPQISIHMRHDSMTLYIECKVADFVDINDPESLQNLVTSHKRRPALIELIETPHTDEESK